MGDLNVTGAASAVNAYGSYAAADTVKAENTNEEAAKINEPGAVFEKSNEVSKATYSINKMTAEERDALVQQLKADQESRQQQLIDIVNKMLTGQANTFAKADDSFWKFLASGEYTVDEETKAQAQQDISEDGYWGVKQTSQRLFDFASALAGDNVELMKDMQAAMEEGFKEATKTWGKDLPDICQDTLDAANKLFEDYYASK